MLLMFLIYLGFRTPTWVVCLWGIIYAMAVLILTLFPIQEAQPSLPFMRPYVRAAFLLVGATAATLVAHHRTRMEKSHEALFNVISALPLAVIISDISGNILLMNREAQKVLSNHVHELSGLSYFSTFISPDEQGRSIATYISYFDSHRTGRVSTILRTRGNPSLTLRASITVIGIDTHRYALTVIEKAEEMAGVTA
jgi:PAS domain-containing protein